MHSSLAFRTPSIVLTLSEFFCLEFLQLLLRFCACFLVLVGWLMDFITLNGHISTNSQWSDNTWAMESDSLPHSFNSTCIITVRHLFLIALS